MNEDTRPLQNITAYVPLISPNAQRTIEVIINVSGIFLKKMFASFLVFENFQSYLFVKFPKGVRAINRFGIIAMMATHKPAKNPIKP